MKKLLAAGLLLTAMLAFTGCGAKITGITAPEKLNTEVGATVAVPLTYNYEKPDTKAEDKAKAESALAIKWSSSDTAVATVDEKGIVTGVAVGKADITATSDKMIANCEVNVTAPPTGIDMEKTLALAIDGIESAELNAKLLPEGATPTEIVYTSSDEKVVTVDASGKITAVGKGTAIISATAGAVKAETEVTVTIAPTEIVLDKTEGILTVGGSITLKPSLLPADAEAAVFTWSSSDESVATVKDGAITAKAAGKATITVSTESGLKAEYTLTVQKKPAAQTSITNKPTGGKGTTTGGGTTGGVTTPPPAGGGTPAPTPPPAPTPAPPANNQGETPPPDMTSPPIPLDPDAGNDVTLPD